MKAIFVLAGQSIRFKGIVEHKSLLRLQGQTLLERLIVQAASLGIKEFVFAVGASWSVVQGEILRVFMEHGISYRQMGFVYSERFAETNNAYTLWLCRQYLQGDLLLFEGDIALDALPVFDRGKPQWFTVTGHEGEGCFLRVGSGGLVNGQEIIDEGKEGWKKSAGFFYLTADTSCLLQKELESQPGDDEYMDAVLARLPFHACDVGIWQEMDDVPDFELAKAKITEPVRYQVDPALL